MLDMAKKAALIGTGMALATTDKIREVVEDLTHKGESAQTDAQTEARKAVEVLTKKTRQTRESIEGETEKIMTDFSAFWYYTNLADELEERVEKIVAVILKKLHIPERQELEDIKKRIEKMEREEA